MLTAEHRSGEVFVRTAPNVVAPWPIDMCERLASRWAARSGSWASDAEQLRNAASKARMWLAAHPAIDFESDL